MTDFRKVTDEFSVAPQIDLGDLAEAARQGFVLVINNRPDGESPDQPSSDEMERAALKAGLRYHYIPVTGGPTQDQIDNEQGVIEATPGPVLAFCRSGTRSIVTWAIGQAQTGQRGRDELIKLGTAAGYDLSGVLN